MNGDFNETEQNILGQLGFEDNAPTETTQENIGADASKETTTTETNNTTNAGTGEGGTANGTGEQQPKQEAQQEKKPEANPADKPVNSQQLANGDLKLADGSIIKAGAERRLYQKNVQLEAQINQGRQVLERLNGENQQLRQTVQALQQANSVDTQLGLSPQESTEARQFMAGYKRDPIGTLRNLLAKAAADGHNLQQIGIGLDGAAMQAALDRRLGPIANQQQQQVSEQEAMRRAAEQAQAFFDEYPDAIVHEAMIADLVSKTGWSPHRAYVTLYKQATARGLDWSLPLADQLRAINPQTNANPGVNTQQQQQPVPPQNQVPMPNGRPNAGVGVTQPRAPVHEATNWDDIIRTSMRETGMLR
jgi:hypothetical protein